MLLSVLYKAVNRIELEGTKTGNIFPFSETQRNILNTETGRIVPKTGRNMTGDNLIVFLASHWHLLKFVGHQLRNRIGGARKDELENILEFNR